VGLIKTIVVFVTIAFAILFFVSSIRQDDDKKTESLLYVVISLLIGIFANM